MLSKRPDASVPPIHVMSFTAETRDEHCQKCEDEGNPHVRQLQEIGYEMQTALDRGEAISDEMYVNMVTTKIRSLFPDQIPKQTPVDAKASNPDAVANPAMDSTDAVGADS